MSTSKLGPAEETLPISPCLIYERNSVPFPLDLELASHFALIEYSRKKSDYVNSKYMFFSKIIWPITYIQADSENYVAVDNLNYFTFSFKITSSPNRGKIGRLLRDASPDKYKLPDILDEVINLVKEDFKEEIQIKGLIDPDVLRGLTTIVKLVDTQPTTHMAKLEDVFSTDDVINIAESFKSAVKKVEDNITSWKEIKNVANSITDEWIIDINREFGEKEKRSQSNLYNLERELQGKIRTYESQKSQEYYELNEWKIKKDKNIANKICETYPIINEFFYNFIEKSKKLKIISGENPDPEEFMTFALNLLKDIENSIPSLKNLLDKTRSDLGKIEKEMQTITSEIRTQEKDIENKFQRLINDVKSQIPKIKDKGDEELANLKIAKDKIEENARSLRERLDKIIKVCENEKSYLKSWTVPGTSIGMVMPINKIWVPLYISEVETADGDEKIIVSPPNILPNHISSERWVPFDFLNTSFKVMLKERLENALEINMELRSNFEFNCSKKNLFSMPDVDKKILRGFDELLKKSLIEIKYINEIRNNWEKSLIK